MIGRKNKFQTQLTLLTVGGVLLALVLSACQDKTTTQAEPTTKEIEAVVQAVDGQQVVLTLDDGSKIRVEAEKQADDAKNMIGDDVKTEIEVGDDNIKLIKIEKSSVKTASDLTGQQVPEDFHFIGVIESMGANMWAIGGKTFQVNAATILDNGLTVGAEADVEFILLADGSMLATSIETQADDDIAEDFSATGVITSLSATEVVLGDQIFKVDANTMLDNGLATGVTARVEFVLMDDGSMLALEVETDAPDDVTPETSSEPGEDFTASGPIQSIDSVSVMVDGRKFMIDANTILDSGLAQGVLAKIEFVVNSDGTLLAKEVETTGIDEGVNLYFAGLIQSINPTAWVVGGRTFAVTPATQLDEGLAVGINANVEFIIKPDGSFEAVHIENSGFKFIGMVQAIAPNAYAIGGHIFNTNANTLIERGLKVGKLAQVNFLIQPDGSLLALQIKVPKTKVQAFTFKGVVQAIGAMSITVTGQTFQTSPITIIGAGVAVGTEVNVVFDIKPGNILLAISVQNAKLVKQK